MRHLVLLIIPLIAAEYILNYVYLTDDNLRWRVYFIMENLIITTCAVVIFYTYRNSGNLIHRYSSVWFLVIATTSLIAEICETAEHGNYYEPIFVGLLIISIAHILFLCSKHINLPKAR